MARGKQTSGEEEMSEAQTPAVNRMSEDELLAFVEAAIDRMPAETLPALITHIQNRQRARQEEEQNRLLEQWREQAAKLGLQVRLEPIGTSTAKRRGTGTGSAIAPKYRGPDGSTWSGRGLPPKWLTSLEAEGRNREEFRIREGDDQEATE